MNVPRQTWPVLGPQRSAATVDSPVAWRRLAVAVVLGTVLGVGMWSMPVVLPAVQTEFGVARGDASLPYTLTMLAFAFGGVVMGRMSDRFGIAAPILCGDARARRRLRDRRVRAQSAAVRVGAHSHRARRVGRVRAADGRHVALVRCAGAGSRWRSCRAGTTWPARSGRRSSSTRSRRRAGGRPTSRSAGVRAADSAAAAADAAAAPPRTTSRPSPCRRPRAGARHFAERADGAVVSRRAVVLRGDGDAAGAHRGLLQRPRLRRGARRRDAGDDAGVRHRQPHRLRASWPTVSAALRRWSSARRCRGLALLLYVFFDGLASSM